MEVLKTVFGDKAMTYAELEAALNGHKDIRLANLAGGQYVDKGKLTEAEQNLATANSTIKQLQDAVKKFDGVDVGALQQSVKDMQKKYDEDTAQLKLNNAIDLSLIAATAKNPKAVKSLLDLSIIKLDGDKLIGVEEQLKALRKSDAYLFADADPVPGAPNPGAPPAGDAGTVGDAIKGALFGTNPKAD